MRPTVIPEDASAEEAVRLALPFVLRGYRRWVNETADELLAEHPASNTPDDLYDAVHDAVDGSWWTSYPLASLLALLVSENDDAFLEDFGREALILPDPTGEPWVSDLYARLAFSALERDLFEELERRMRPTVQGEEGVEP